MPQSLSRILLHLVFSTKNRTPLINDDLQPRLYAYITAILSNLKCPSLQTGGAADHVHILCCHSRTVALCDLMEEVKKSTSKWMKNVGVPIFSWQSGYGAFSIGESQIEKLIRYIQIQKEHHKVVTFQQEYRKFLELYKIEYDEKYVWD
ncbi:transposase [Chitinispirillales bacterium ANBcel5]|uniref:transposase n=1 Tax=Cellulosispirillum alkaliphilum TaxID=3039283 RepID=UPI002A58ACB6|nr:transposase [Chitinispirillales bacterium ANBcel5]